MWGNQADTWKSHVPATASAVSVSSVNHHSQLPDTWWSHVEQRWAFPTEASPHCRFISKIMFLYHPYNSHLCWFRSLNSPPPNKCYQQGLPWWSSELEVITTTEPLLSLQATEPTGKKGTTALAWEIIIINKGKLGYCSTLWVRWTVSGTQGILWGTS